MKSLPTSYTAARKWGIILLLALASLGAALLSMSFGSTQVPFSEILTALMGGETQAYNIVVYARLPRTLAALLCGSALAVGGVIIQGVLGNPLAGPNIIGVNAGAGLGAVLCAALIPTSMTAVPVAAFLGALGACMLVYTLARRTGASRITLVLAGVAISSMLSAAIDAVSILFPEAALGAGSFMVGRLSGVTVAALKVPALLSLLAGAGAFGGNGTFLSSERLNPTLLQSGRLFTAGGAEDATALAAIKAADPGKIYLLVGANGVSWLSAEDMVKSLGDFVDRLRQQHPKAAIVLSTLPYFDAATQGDHPNYQNTKVEEYNRQLSALCAEKEVYLLDSAQVLSGAHAVGLRDGSLTLADGAADAWADYIFTHTVG